MTWGDLFKEWYFGHFIEELICWAGISTSELIARCDFTALGFLLRLPFELLGGSSSLDNEIGSFDFDEFRFSHSGGFLRVWNKMLIILVAARLERVLSSNFVPVVEFC
jgi:hypothetical protein